MQDPPTRRRTFAARRSLQKEAAAFVAGFDTQEPLFELGSPATPAPPVVRAGDVVELNFERSRRRFPEGA